MKEDFLHYLWKFQKFSVASLASEEGGILHILNQGQHNLNSGPDFFNAQIELDGQRWAGNVEIHIKSSDWYAHNHQEDAAYDNVILHVVWQHDAEIFRKDGSAIPTFILEPHISKCTLERYELLFSKKQKWINCENDFDNVNSFTIANWLERLYFERLQNKEEQILKELDDTQNHWEALLFRLLCKNFGLVVNGESFFSIAKSIDFSILKKCSQERLDLEALLFGQSGLLDSDKEDWYFKMHSMRYLYLKTKFQLRNEGVIAPKFFRLRPSNFPTLRLAQLAALYAEKKNLFSEVIAAKTVSEFYTIFDIMAGEYWDTHYNFGVRSVDKKKRLTKKFIDLLIINTIVPLKFCYAMQQGKDISEEILKLTSAISSEENSIVKKFNSLKRISSNAYQSQALLQLKKEYCDKNRCLQCALGSAIVGNNKGEQARTV